MWTRSSLWSLNSLKTRKSPKSKLHIRASLWTPAAVCSSCELHLNVANKHEHQFDLMSMKDSCFSPGGEVWLSSRPTQQLLLLFISWKTVWHLKDVEQLTCCLNQVLSVLSLYSYRQRDIYIQRKAALPIGEHVRRRRRQNVELLLYSLDFLFNERLTRRSPRVKLHWKLDHILRCLAAWRATWPEFWAAGIDW